MEPENTPASSHSGLMRQPTKEEPVWNRRKSPLGIPKEDTHCCLSEISHVIRRRICLRLLSEHRDTLHGVDDRSMNLIMDGVHDHDLFIHSNLILKFDNREAVTTA